MLDLHQSFRLPLTSTTKMIYDVKDDPILQVSSQEPSTFSKSQMKPDTWIMLDLHQNFRISSWSFSNMIYDVKDDPILQISSHKLSTSLKPPCNQSYLIFAQLNQSLNSINTNHQHVLKFVTCIQTTTQGELTEPKLTPPLFDYLQILTQLIDPSLPCADL